MSQNPRTFNGSGFGSVGGAVASKGKGLQFKSFIGTIYYTKYPLLTVEKTTIKSKKEARNGPFKNTETILHLGIILFLNVAPLAFNVPLFGRLVSRNRKTNIIFTKTNINLSIDVVDVIVSLGR